jgi:hypothetical protein
MWRFGGLNVPFSGMWRSNDQININERMIVVTD